MTNDQLMKIENKKSIKIIEFNYNDESQIMETFNDLFAFDKYI